MKKLKLSLDKQQSARLTSEEAGSVYGGGYKQSQRLNGLCNYSNKHPLDLPTSDASGNVGRVSCRRG